MPLCLPRRKRIWAGCTERASLLKLTIISDEKDFQIGSFVVCLKIATVAKGVSSWSLKNQKGGSGKWHSSIRRLGSLALVFWCGNQPDYFGVFVCSVMSSVA